MHEAYREWLHAPDDGEHDPLVIAEQAFEAGWKGRHVDVPGSIVVLETQPA